MPYYSITLDGQNDLQKIGYFITTNIFSKDYSNAMNDAKNKIRKKLKKYHNIHTDHFEIINIEEIFFFKKNTNFYFYNL